MVGSRGFEPRSARSERAASADCATSRRCTGPSGWTRTTTSRVKSPVCCVHTTEGHWTDGANGGTRTRTSRLGRPAGTITPHSRWFGLGYQSLIPGPNADRRRSPAQELLSVVKDPALASWFGDSARIRTRTHEVWRLGCCRYTTLSLLHHISTASETKPPHDLTRAFCRAPDQNKKGLPGDRPRRPVSR